ncbi:MAG TPA: STAS domain-containing protein [Candidatus Limnocylindria bacterium]|nr:STAS domain-containing protein [Candidatus Limnocylindria bacterium]
MAPADLVRLCDGLRALLERSRARTVECDVGAVTNPDLATIDALARLQLTARRSGGRIRLRDASVELRELLELLGLRDALPCARASRLEARGQAEEREELRGVEEEGDAADPVA